MTSDVCKSSTEAKEKVSSQAVEAIMSNEELATIYNAPKPEKEFPKDETGLRHRQNLAIFVMKIFRGNLKKGDISYETKTVDEGGFVSTVTISVLPEKWKNLKFTGQICEDEAHAEHDAARDAMEAMKEDEDLMALHDAKKKKDDPEDPSQLLGWMNEIGKGKGMGKERFKEEDLFTMLQMMTQMIGGKGKGKGKGKQSAQPPGEKFMSQITDGRPAKKQKVASGKEMSSVQTVNSLCMRISKRPMKKGEIEYTALEVEGGWQATVRVPSEVCEDTVFASEVKGSSKEAKESAAGFAVEAIRKQHDTVMV